jgi:transcriptional regulator with XRE-family HTH domain
LTQEALAELMGVSVRTVRNVETSDHGVTVPVMLKFRAAKQTVKAGSMKAPRELKRVPR